ncbi:hypothetical protein [Sphingomonas oligoaromativorans]|uniref:hypothetical protein n=1 Tax=Sphingomonas oligoaromativorans TaxID=575322 RepID=UPI00142335AC|nr:hypothetical protein [Sphingomonas oligoaromativorans]NIJ34304.1 hypothetical protein [Sphingomonas oligoaromativorans]
MPGHPNQLFCTDPHKQAWHNRQTTRGRVLTPLQLAARITRDGSRGDTVTGTYARQASRRLLDRWAKEDREGGRMSAVAYVSLRKSKGFESL